MTRPPDPLVAMRWVFNEAAADYRQKRCDNRRRGSSREKGVRVTADTRLTTSEGERLRREWCAPPFTKPFCLGARERASTLRVLEASPNRKSRRCQREAFADVSTSPPGHVAAFRGEPPRRLDVRNTAKARRQEPVLLCSTRAWLARSNARACTRSSYRRCSRTQGYASVTSTPCGGKEP